MLQTLHLCQNLRAPVYGMNRGTVGFMMNAYEIKALPLRLANAEQQIINPLIMKATLVYNKIIKRIRSYLKNPWLQKCGRSYRNWCRRMAMNEIWHNPRCSKSRIALTLLKDQSVDMWIKKDTQQATVYQP